MLFWALILAVVILEPRWDRGVVGLFSIDGDNSSRSLAAVPRPAPLVPRVGGGVGGGVSALALGAQVHLVALGVVRVDVVAPAPRALSASAAASAATTARTLWCIHKFSRNLSA
jgi:hypothetical protein